MSYKRVPVPIGKRATKEMGDFQADIWVEKSDEGFDTCWRIMQFSKQTERGRIFKVYSEGLFYSDTETIASTSAAGEAQVLVDVLLSRLQESIKQLGTPV